MKTINLILAALFAGAAVWTLWARVQWPFWLVAVLLADIAVQAALDARRADKEDGR